MKHLIGYYIRRTYRASFPSGKTICAYPQRLFETKESAEAVLREYEVSRVLDRHYDHDVTAVWFDDGTEP